RLRRYPVLLVGRLRRESVRARLRLPRTRLPVSLGPPEPEGRAVKVAEPPEEVGPCGGPAAPRDGFRGFPPPWPRRRAEHRPGGAAGVYRCLMNDSTGSDVHGRRNCLILTP